MADEDDSSRADPFRGWEAWLGLEADDLRIYRAMLGTSGDLGDISGLCKATDLDRGRVAAGIDRLRADGFVDGNRPTPPGSALRALLHRRMAQVRSQQADLELAAGSIDDLVAHFVGGSPHTVGDLGIELITGPHSVGERANSLMDSAQSELLVLNAPPYAQLNTPPYVDLPAARPSVAEDSTGRAVTRGVHVRHVIAQEGVDVPHRMSELTELAALGLEVRVRPQLPTKLIVADRTTALLPPSAVSDPAAAALVIHDGLMMNLLVPMFEAMWDTALPLGTVATTGEEDEQTDDEGEGLSSALVAPGPTDEERMLLGLLASGLKDEAIARQLGVHVHTARRRITALLGHLGAATRFQAGIQAARRGWM